jgi:hypothetical protein
VAETILLSPAVSYQDMVLNKIPPKHDLRPILEALLDELSRGSAGVPPTLDSMKVKWIIDQGDPNRYEESGFSSSDKIN